MNLEQFIESIDSKQKPENLGMHLEALWEVAAGNWHIAHEIVQNDAGRKSSLIHAYLHRVEGDEGNAAYWYSRAGRSKAEGDLKEEWKKIVQELL
ncbi:MAG: hypothetical protein JJU28_05150 [Cyclobacteriaceae bacterium]|nr:hypothetical protein [Cyclobacteriaceae bacterium]